LLCEAKKSKRGQPMEGLEVGSGQEKDKSREKAIGTGFLQ